MVNNIKTNHESGEGKPGFFSLLKTAAAAAFGVQSDRNREADFSQKTVIPYIVIGILFTAAFIGTLIVIVSFVVE
ncbi:Protein of unknown function (DUF2970) [Alteromonadaceae bacterium 2753L.S.0a.02]|nr:Protein of unknown function (DUF2970) [Alteromonadaceae bacterium 2753L.S.0a.02]